jgi:hypothetical protein
MGRQKHIESPDHLWALFDAYRIHLKSNPITLVEQKKGTTVIPKGLTVEEYREFSNSIIELPAQRPLTLEGFENYCADLEIINDLGDYFANTDNRYADYTTICKRIRRVIRQDQIEGGMAGIYNPSITQRLNGLVDRVQEDGTKEVTIKVKYEQKGIGGSPEPPALGTGDSLEE